MNFIVVVISTYLVDPSAVFHLVKQWNDKNQNIVVGFMTMRSLEKLFCETNEFCKFSVALCYYDLLLVERM